MQTTIIIEPIIEKSMET